MFASFTTVTSLNSDIDFPFHTIQRVDGMLISARPLYTFPQCVVNPKISRLSEPTKSLLSPRQMPVFDAVGLFGL